jgi:Tfp pilus assembly major pilin PilA
MRKQSGFAIVELGFVLFVVAIIGVIGFMVYDNFLKPKPTETAVMTSPSPSVSPVQVRTASDLSKVDTQLSNVSVDDSDSSTLDSAASSF